MKHMLKNKNFFFVYRFYHGQLVSIGIVYVFCVIIERVYRLRNVEKFVEFYFMYFRLSFSSKSKTFCKCICGTNLHTFDFKILTYIFHVCTNHAN